MMDVSIENHGSVVMVRPLSTAAARWVTDNVHLEAWQWMGAAFACEPRYVEGLVEGMEAEGLEVARA